MDLQLQSHPAVDHPDSLLKDGKRNIRKANDFAALKLAAFYGAALTIWLFALYTMLGAIFVKEQPTLLYWSNGAQLIFCPLMVYVGNLISKKADAKKESDHKALTHIANVLDMVADHVTADCEDCIAAEPLAPISNPNWTKTSDKLRAIMQAEDNFDTMTSPSHRASNVVEC